MNKQLLLNLFGQPGSGKSSSFGTLFGYLKNRGMSVEIAPEMAKPMVYAGRQEEMRNQVYMLAQQYKPIDDIARDGSVGLIITDCPILLGIVYAEEAGLHYSEELAALIYKIHLNEYENINVFVKRTKPYNPAGRNQDEAQSDALVAKIEALTHFDYEINGDEEGQIWLGAELIKRYGERIALKRYAENE